MNLAVALVAFSSMFLATVIGIASQAVTASAWLGLYLAGALALCVQALLQRGSRRDAVHLTPSTFASVFGYSFLLSAIFFGADQALSILGNSVRPRTEIPHFLGGLEFYFVLFPGVGSVAFGALAASLVQRFMHSGHRQTGVTSQSGASGA